MVLVASLHELSRPSSPSGLLHGLRHLGNALEIRSAVENVLTLTYLNNKHLHMYLDRPLLTQHNTQSKKQKQNYVDE